MIKIFYAALFTFFATTVNATVVIEFEGIIPSGSNRPVVPIFPYLEDGFLLTDISSGRANALFGPSGSQNDNGTDVLGWLGNTTFQIAHGSGELFSLISFDGTNLEPLGGPGNFGLVGFFGAGGSIFTRFTNTFNTFSTFNLTAEWSGLSSVQISNAGIIAGAVDNITLSSSHVPAPSVLALFGLGLVGLSLSGCRRSLHA